MTWAGKTRINFSILQIGTFFYCRKNEGKENVWLVPVIKGAALYTNGVCWMCGGVGGGVGG